MLENFTSQKYTETHYLVIILSYQEQASEPQVDSRYQLILGSEVGLLSEINQYSCDEVLSGTVPSPSMN